MLFDPSAGILDQAQKARRGRFNIGAFARAKRLAKEAATAVAVSKNKQLQTIKTNLEESCAGIEKEIHTLKRKVEHCRRLLYS